MKNDLRRGIKSLWKTKNWHSKMESLWESLSLPYVDQDPPEGGEPFPLPMTRMGRGQESSTSESR